MHSVTRLSIWSILSDWEGEHIVFVTEFKLDWFAVPVKTLPYQTLSHTHTHTHTNTHTHTKPIRSLSPHSLNSLLIMESTALGFPSNLPLSLLLSLSISPFTLCLSFPSLLSPSHFPFPLSLSFISLSSSLHQAHLPPAHSPACLSAESC